MHLENARPGLLEFETLTGEEIRNLLAGKRPVREQPEEPKPQRGSPVPQAGRGRPRPEPDAGLEPQPQT